MINGWPERTTDATQRSRTPNQRQHRHPQLRSIFKTRTGTSGRILSIFQGCYQLLLSDFNKLVVTIRSYQVKIHYRIATAAIPIMNLKTVLLDICKQKGDDYKDSERGEKLTIFPTEGERGKG